MPYMVVERDDEFCIFKHDEDDQPVGESLGCHPSREAAEEQMAALYASEGKSAKHLCRVEVKSMDENTAVVAGWGVVFGGLDLEGDTFTKDTEFMLDLVPRKPVSYDHAMGEVKHFLGEVIKAEVQDGGIWIEAQLDRHKEYVEYVIDLVKRGALGWSSQAVSTFVERERGTLKRWPIVEWALTPTPAEPRTIGVEQLKGAFAAAGIELPGALVSVGSGSEALNEESVKNDKTVEVKTMETADIQKLIADELAKRDAEAKAKADFEALLAKTREEGKQEGLKEAEGKMASWTGRKGALYMSKAPKGSEGGADEGPMKAWLYYIRTGDKGATKALQEGTDCEGGYLVPQGFEQTIVTKLAELSWPRLAGVSIYQTNRDSFRVPTEGTEPSVPAAIAEEASYTTDSPTVEAGDVTIYKFPKLIKVSEELLEDDAGLTLSWLNRKVPEIYAEAEGKAVAVGSGSSAPQGIFVGGTAGLTFDSSGNITADEVPELFYKLQGQYRGRASTGWLMHPDTEAYIRMIRDSNHFAFPGGDADGGTVARGDWRLSSLYSRPVFNDDDCATMTTSAKVIAVGDFSYYALVEHVGGMKMKRLEELYAATGQIGLRFSKRFGGVVLQAEAFQYGTLA